MRLALRVVGTLLIAFAVILIIIDGTRSLAANGLVFTPLEATWQSMHAESLAAVRDFLSSRLFGPVLEPVVSAILSFPGWAVVRLRMPEVAARAAGRGEITIRGRRFTPAHQ